MRAVPAEPIEDLRSRGLWRDVRLTNLFFRNVERCGGRIALVDAPNRPPITDGAARRLRSRELAAETNALSRELLALGLEKNDILVRNLAVEWGPRNIRVICIAPGLIETDFARALWENPELLAHTQKMTPLGRLGTPDEIGGLVACLASKAGAFISGEVIVADGGMSFPGAPEVRRQSSS